MQPGPVGSSFIDGKMKIYTKLSNWGGAHFASETGETTWRYTS